MGPKQKKDKVSESSEKDEKMAPTQNTQTENATTTNTKLVVVQDMKPQQTALNYELGEDVKVTLIYKTYTLNPKVPFSDAVLMAAAELVTPDTAKAEAFVQYASRQSYQEAKALAFSGPGILHPEIKRIAVDQIMSVQGMENQKRSDIESRWITGLKAKTPGSLVWLDRAKAIYATSTEEIDF